MSSRRPAASVSAPIGRTALERGAPTSAPGGGPADAADDSPDPAPARPRRRRRWLRWLLIAFGLFVLLVIGGVIYLWRLPFPNPHPLAQSTIVYDANGKVLGVYSEQNRVDVPLTRVPKVVIDAVVSTEDRHFFSEGGISPVGIARALFADVTGSGSLQGGSTITQQYVKQAYLTPKRTLLRKIEEVALAVRLSHKQSKDQILDEYLNTIYWGRGSYGIEAASEAYFGEDVSRLGLPQASLLAGLIREPETADPANNPSIARRNQADTLRAMIRDKEITAAQAAAVEAMPFSRYVVPPSGSGAKKQTTGDDYFLAAVRDELYAKFGQQMVDGGGLRVTTTLDSALQSEAYNSVYGHGPNALDPARGDPSAAVVSIDDSGDVRALVGGQDYARSTVNLALGTAGGGSGRQAGSTFKAFMLAYLIKQGYSVQSVFPAPSTLVVPDGNPHDAPWNVTNYEHEAVAPSMNLVDATALSVNTVYAQVVARLGAANLDAMAESLGISRSELAQPYLSQVLGTADVSPLEMAAAYATFADGGIYHTPVLVTKVTTSNGSPLPLPVAPTARPQLTPSQAALETYVLQQVVSRGTGVSAGGVGSPVAGKTGTTENSGDAWFIGYTPKLTTALWMGYAASSRSMDGFRGLGSVTGGSIPAEMWHDYMSAVLASSPQYGGSFPAVTSFGGKILTPLSRSPLAATTLPGYVVPPVTTAPGSATTTAPVTIVPIPPAGTSPTSPPGLPGPPTTGGPPTTSSAPTTSAPTSTTSVPTTTVPPTTSPPTTAGSGSGSG